ncbi:MAG: 4'-phosphopantetheinyl transferase superfamily protein [Pseudomonadota bacterium]|nr:4'-phosphopantetheinyl transferase superfamily protein [Pseudomonadota bacterium]
MSGSACPSMGFGCQELVLFGPARRAGVRLWLLNFSALPESMRHYASVLTADEKERWRRFRCPRAAFGYAACRWHLRCLLLSLFGKQAVAWRIGVRSCGKPFVQAPPGRFTPFFNLSHSGSYGCIAVAAGQPVGVDIEPHEPHAWLGAVQRRWHATERRHARRGTAAFYDIWTRKEAVLKARGCGFGDATVPEPLVLAAPIEAQGAPDLGRPLRVGDVRLVSVPAGADVSLALAWWPGGRTAEQQHQLEV